MTKVPRPLHHICISVPDIHKGIEFYETVFGYRLFAGPRILSSETDSTGQFLDLFGSNFKELKIAHLSTGGGTGLELFQPVNPEYIQDTARVPYQRSGVSHICVTDPNIDELAEKIVANGGQRISKIWADRLPHEQFKMIYCKDPFGTVIEIHTHSYEYSQAWRP